MKNKSLNLKIGAVVVALALISGIAAIPAVSASANSAQEKWYGCSASGMFVTDENCPVVVESETLTFNIQTFPDIYYYDQENFAKYDASVTAHYNFYNPADYEVHMTLAFPFGDYPSYLGDHLDESGKYLVTADGEAVESSVRHTLSYGAFNAEKEVAKILDGYKEDEFYSPKTPVHYYTCKFSGFDGDKIVYLKSVYDKSNTAVFYSTQNAGYNLSPYAIYPQENSANPVTYVQDGSIIYLFAVGEDFDGEPQFSFGQSWPLFGGNTTDCVEITKQEITFKDLMLAYYDAGYEVSETDWYNAAMEYLEEYGYIHYTMYNSLMRWFEYQLTIPAGGRLVNEVTAPLYPDINGYYSPDLYTYEYLLSPAKCWASFGSLDIVINTPYYLSNNTLGEFEKIDGGYTLHLEKLPDVELNFTLCEERHYHHSSSGGGIALNVVSLIFVIYGAIILGLQIIAAIPMIIVFAVTGKFSSKPKEKKL